jgi:hypothetical protein
LFYSEDNKPKALTNGDGWSHSCGSMAAIIWNLGTGCITLVCYSIKWPQWLQQSESQHFCSQTRQRYQLFCFSDIANQN